MSPEGADTHRVGVQQMMSDCASNPMQGQEGRVALFPDHPVLPAGNCLVWPAQSGWSEGLRPRYKTARLAVPCLGAECAQCCRARLWGEAAGGLGL